MRILFVVHQFMPEFAAGTERVTLNLAQSAQRDGHHADVLTCSMRDEVPWEEAGEWRCARVDGVQVFGLRGAGVTPLQQLGLETDVGRRHVVERFLKGREPYDVVHFTHPMRMLEVVEAVRDRGLPYVLTLTDFYLMCWQNNLVRLSGELCSGPAGGAACVRHCSTLRLNDRMLLERWERMGQILADADAIVACSPYVAQSFQAEYPDLPIRIIPHGINLLDFAPARPSAGDAIVFGYVGTLSAMKGVDVLVEAFAKTDLPQARLKLVGPTFDDDLARTLEQFASADERISIHPAIPAAEVPAMLATFDILCLPSRVPETFSLAVHEAFAANLPCIVSDLGHPAQVIREHGCGMVAPSGDVTAWAEALHAAARGEHVLAEWQAQIPLPFRVEEEGFLYSQIYTGLVRSPETARRQHHVEALTHA
ncbi:MAG TPA: glycosyltransferase [Microvirga sp.]|jgi:glycosyltransferase involved in cell wall biosynthesis